MPITIEGTLSECQIATNCVLVQWELENINQSYERLVGIALKLPRTITLEKNADYWHGLCRSLVFRFPDDLEILKIPKKGIVQVRSASRFGLGDLGVNRSRVNTLYRKLMDKN